jgi:glycosyltransferase involved in cell wall biosynthesis
MRVLHVSRRYRNVGGMERYLHDLCRLMRDAGHAVAVAYDEATFEDFVIPGVHATHIPGVATDLPSRNEIAWRLLADLVAQFDPDVIQIHDLANPYTTVRVQDLRPTLAFVQTCGYYCMGTKSFPSSGAVCERAFGPGCLAKAFACGCATRRPAALLRDYTRVHRELAGVRACRSLMVASGYMRDVLATNGIPAERIRVVLPFTAPVPEPPALPQQPRLLFVGRLATGKGIERLLEAMAHLPEATLDVVGDGDRRSAAESLARALGVVERVRFLGWRSEAETSAQYAAARVVVVPSVWPEPFGLVGIEAMARGRPVVGIDRGGVAEWLEDGVTGLLSEPSPEALAAAVRRVLADGVAERMGARARQRCRERFTFESHWRGLRAAYDWAGERYRSAILHPEPALPCREWLKS